MDEWSKSPEVTNSARFIWAVSVELSPPFPFTDTVFYNPSAFGFGYGSDPSLYAY